jgi:hypothetical protein
VRILSPRPRTAAVAGYLLSEMSGSGPWSCRLGTSVVTVRDFRFAPFGTKVLTTGLLHG